MNPSKEIAPIQLFLKNVFRKYKTSNTSLEALDKALLFEKIGDKGKNVEFLHQMTQPETSYMRYLLKKGATSLAREYYTFLNCVLGITYKKFHWQGVAISATPPLTAYVQRDFSYQPVPHTARYS